MCFVDVHNKNIVDTIRLSVTTLYSYRLKWSVCCCWFFFHDCCVSGNNAASCCLLSSDVNDCATRPCNNGGVCRDLDGDYTCQCPSPYVGKQCQLRTFTKCNHFFSFHWCIISCHWFFKLFVFVIEQTTKYYVLNVLIIILKPYSTLQVFCQMYI